MSHAASGTAATPFSGHDTADDGRLPLAIRALIKRYGDTQVVEVYGDWGGTGGPGGGAEAWAAHHAATFSQRFEVSGETAFCYVTDATPLIAHLETQPGLRYLHRPANLEDVFLRLTGRELRD